MLGASVTTQLEHTAPSPFDAQLLPPESPLLNRVNKILSGQLLKLVLNCVAGEGGNPETLSKRGTSEEALS